MVKKSPEGPKFERQYGSINGLECHSLEMRTHISLQESRFCRLVNQSSTQEVQFNEFCPGSIIIFRSVCTPKVG